MHEAYLVSPLLKVTYQVECIAAYNESLLVGTRQGHLCMYNLIKNEDQCNIELMRYNKSFSKKPVQQLEVISDYNILISLTDNLIQIHDLNAITFTTIYQLQKSKGATFFATNVKKHTSMTGEVTSLVRMAVVVKRKVQLYYLKNNEFLPLMDDISLNDIPRSMVWCQESICVGYRGEYALLELDGKHTDLFPTSSTRSSEPCLIRVSDTTFALCRENQTVIVNVKGETEMNKALRWSDVPVTMAWDEPYALGILNDSIEVLTLDPSGLVQTLTDLPKVRFIVSAQQGLLFAASISQIWCMTAVDVAKQRAVLVDDKQFQLALKLTQISNESEDEKKEKVHHIQTLLAYDLFHRKQFHESMKEFLKLETDVYDVIRLFPDLLPQQQQVSEIPDPVRDMTDNELETSRLALIDYLIEMRRRLQSSDVQVQANVNARGNLNERVASKSTNQLLQIIDTTLLKCYLQTNDALVAPLLRLNHCHLVETEKILKKMGKHNELIILYQTKGQHRRALELLQSEGSVERTIGYLQHLGSEHMGLILVFADWVLTESPENGLKIFTEDIAEVESLPRPRILDFLLKSHKSVVIPYLEHVIHTWEDSNPLFHNALIHQYREKVILEGSVAAEHTQKKLLHFLETSHQYTPENVLSNFPTNSLLEERAILLGRLGKHEESIAIYVRALGDVQKAERYCKKIYETGVSGTESVYVSLIKLILEPDSIPLALPGLTLSPKTAQPDLELALKLLEEHANHMNPLEALAILPDSVPVSRINKFLSIALQRVIKERRNMQLMKGLLYAEHLQCQEVKLALQSQHVLVTEMNVCPVCKKRFGNQSALVRYPNGDVVHYSCQERKL
nr:vam6/Vps39-like protein isoform X1 [Leptinotarsa decemlineata]